MKKDPEKPSVRDRVTRNRDVCFVLYTHIDLTVEEFRESLATELRQLRLSEQSRQNLMARIVPAAHVSLPTDPYFWHVLQEADKVERLHPRRPDCRAERWAEEVFHQGKATPPMWFPMARTILSVLREVRDAAHVELRKTSHQLRKSWEQGKESGLLEAVRGGLIQEPWVSKVIFDQQQRWRTGTAKGKRDAKGVLKLVGGAIKGPGSGNTEKLSLEEKETVEADFIHWCSLFEKLNKPLKRAWDNPAWEQASEEQRQAIRERLVKEFSLSLEEVSTAERYLKVSARCGLATPTEAAAELVAEKYGLAAGTVEKIHQGFLERHPERRKKKRKSPTTPVAERTA